MILLYDSRFNHLNYLTLNAIRHICHIANIKVDREHDIQRGLPPKSDKYMMFLKDYSCNLFYKAFMLYRGYDKCEYFFNEAGIIRDTVIVSKGYQYYDARFIDSVETNKIKPDASIVKILKKNNPTKWKQTTSSKPEINSIKKLKKPHLIIGQVQNDHSLSTSITSLSIKSIASDILLHHPDADILFKPHPKSKDPILKSDRIKIISNVNIHDLLDICENVHVMTSGVGLEALINGNRVFTYGTSFYSNRGLTIDKCTTKMNRPNISLDQMLHYFYVILHQCSGNILDKIKNHTPR